MKEFMIRGLHLDDDLQAVVSAVHNHFDQSTKPLSIKFTDRRSLDANAILHVWIKQISDKTGEDTKTVLCRVKRDFGLPILLSDPEYGPVAGYILEQTGFERMSDSQQLKVISCMEVTRLLSTSQHKTMRDNMQAYYNQHGFNLQYMEKGDEQEKEQ